VQSRIKGSAEPLLIVAAGILGIVLAGLTPG
jgi:hypothetical protein